MSSKQLLIAFWFYVSFSFGCFAFWIYLFVDFGGSLLDDIWLPIVGIIVAALAMADLYAYRLVKGREGKAGGERRK